MARSSQKKKVTVHSLTAPQQAPPPKKNPEYGEEGYDPFKDPMNIGFQLGRYGGTTNWLPKKLGKETREEIDAYDFYTDPETGKRPEEGTAPSGGTTDDLEEDGVDEDTTLPPIAIWKQGEYLTDLMKEEDFMKPDLGGFDELPFMVRKKVEDISKERLEKDGSIPEELWNIFVVPGEGTPGNNVWRVYYLPHDIAADLGPKHPLMWPKKYQKGTRKKWGLSSGGYGSAYTPPKPKEPETPKAPSIPASVRMRCTGCGHWFKMNDLSSHSGICPAQGDSDWAMMCDQACGCQTLDDVSKCKPGFPRPKQETPAEETNPNGDGSGSAEEPQKELVAAS